MMFPAKPTYFKQFRIVIVVRLNTFICTADFADTGDELTCFDCISDCLPRLLSLRPFSSMIALFLCISKWNRSPPNGLNNPITASESSFWVNLQPALSTPVTQGLERNVCYLGNLPKRIIPLRVNSIPRPISNTHVKKHLSFVCIEQYIQSFILKQAFLKKPQLFSIFP